MTQSIDLGVAPHAEIALVASAIRIYRRGSQSGTGVVLDCHEGCRRWQLAGDDAFVTVTGDAADFSDAYEVPAQFVSSAADIAAMGQEVALSWRGSKMTATNSVSAISMTVLRGTAPTSPVSQVASVRATMPYRHLFRVLDTASEPAADFPSLDLDDGLPDSWLRIEDGRITCGTDWTEVGGRDVCVSGVATTEGSALVRLDPPTMNNLTSLHAIEGNPDATVAVDPIAGEWLQLEYGPMRLAVRTVVPPAQAVFNEAQAWLKARDATVVTDERGTIVAEEHGVATRIAILEADWHDVVTRITSVVLREAVETLELLREINAFNLTLTTSRVWLDGDKVVVGSDLYQSEFDEDAFSQHYGRVCQDAQRLAGVLAPLAATQLETSS